MRTFILASCLILAQCQITVAKKPTADTDDAGQEFFRDIRTGDQEAVSEAIAKGIDVNATRHGLTPWLTAKRAGFEQIAKLLESKGAKSDAKAPSVGESLDAFLGPQFTKETPACVVLVSRNGKIIAQKAYGMADIEAEIPATVETRFLIGSVTKQFTAAAILKLQEEGKLSVQDKLSKYLPGYPRGDEVTLHHLLTHTSGITSYTSKPEFMTTVTKAVTEDEQIDSFKNDEFDFNPGDKFSYCNSGYFLLGHIVGKVSDSSLAEYLDKTFFKPLGMKNSGIYTHDESVNIAKGYSYVEDKPELAKVWHMSQAGGAGAIYSTLGDMYKWNEALFGGKVLNESSLKAAFSSTKLNDGETSEYGYGWQLGNQRGLKVIQHSGGLDGFVSNLIRYPKQNVTVVAFVNAAPTGEIPAPTTTTSNVGEYVLWDQMEPRQPRVVDKSVDPKTFSDFVGMYDYGSPIVLEVTVEDDQLYGQLTGQAKYPVFPRSPTKFFWRITEAEVEFVRDDSGKVVKAIHRQNGGTSHNKKMPSAKTFKLADEQLEAFVGKYDYGAAVMTVTRDGNQLYAKLTGQAAYKIYPESESTFVWRIVKAKIEFKKDDDGNVVKGIHTQGGRTFDVAKIEDVNTIKVDPEKLDEYVGQYNYGLLAGKMVVTRDENKLMAKLRGQPKLEILPIAKDEFRWKDVNASIQFVRDENGDIIHGLHTQGGNTITVPRVGKKK